MIVLIVLRSEISPEARGYARTAVLEVEVQLRPRGQDLEEDFATYLRRQGQEPAMCWFRHDARGRRWPVPKMR